MRIHRIASLGLICFGLVGYQVAEAQDAQTHAANLFPAETQGMVRVENLPSFSTAGKKPNSATFRRSKG